MDLRTGSSSVTKGAARLGVLPDVDTGALNAAVEDSGVVGTCGRTGCLLRDVAMPVTVHGQLDRLLLQLIVNPDPAAHSDLGTYLVVPEGLDLLPMGM